MTTHQEDDDQQQPAGPCAERPAAIEERKKLISFHAVNNDGRTTSTIILTGLKNLYQAQLPEMPKAYIARLVYDRTHLSLALLKPNLHVIGGITIRPFEASSFAEVVFLAIHTNEQSHGYGAHLMAHLKDYVRATTPKIEYFLTYADNLAIGFFRKQGFTRDVDLSENSTEELKFSEKKWGGVIKDYEGGTLMQCTLVPKVRYLEQKRMLQKQREVTQAKMLALDKRSAVHQPPAQWKNGAFPIDPMSISAIAASGWTPEMDAASREPRRGRYFDTMQELLDRFTAHESSWPFREPVDQETVPDYYDRITSPMDFATMSKRLEKGSYTAPEAFVADLKLILVNCKFYNEPGSSYANLGVKLERFMKTLVRETKGLEW